MAEMGRLEFTTPREAWGGEASAFTPKLGTDDLLAYLGETTGIGPLSVVDVEHLTAGKRSLDILAETGDGRLVAIENQYGVSDHDHLTRGLAYAVATGARALVVVAEEHRDEFVSVADYLNTVAGYFGDEGILVWLLKVRAVRRVGDTVWSPEFIVRTEPNEWEAAIAGSARGGLANLEEFYFKCEEKAGPEWSHKARQIIDGWVARGLTETHTGKEAVALYCPFPTIPGRGRNVLQVWTSGSLVVVRRYMLEVGVFEDDDDIDQLDAQIRSQFPSANWPPKGYYITVKDPDPSAVDRFAEWLTTRLQGGYQHGTVM